MRNMSIMLLMSNIFILHEYNLLMLITLKEGENEWKTKNIIHLANI